jgi:hypothetical protein
MHLHTGYFTGALQALPFEYKVFINNYLANKGKRSHDPAQRFGHFLQGGSHTWPRCFTKNINDGRFIIKSIKDGKVIYEPGAFHTGR